MDPARRVALRSRSGGSAARLETLQGQSEPTQLQYSQIVLINFNTLSWPHVTVGTLTKAE